VEIDSSQLGVEDILQRAGDADHPVTQIGIDVPPCLGPPRSMIDHGARRQDHDQSSLRVPEVARQIEALRRAAPGHSESTLDSAIEPMGLSPVIGR